MSQTPMPPPTAEPFASRILLGPALRAQPDRRLVTLVREGYEAAFEEIVRRYGKPLDRFAASFVGNRSEDVTQDAFSKALLALRGTEKEIELRPWLYRIVRNTALNDIRDRPPTVEQLEETLAGGQSAAVEAERRDEMTELMARLRALPESQRAAIVMRELEGLSHDEIAAALGVSGGAARQAIHRARVALRNGLGLLVPLPLLRALFEHGAVADAAGAAGAATAGGASLGGIGAGGAVKAGLATVLIAGSVGAAGVTIENERSGSSGPEQAEAAVSGGDLDVPDAGGSGSSGPGGGDTGSSGPGSSPGDSGEGSGNSGRGSGDDRDEDREGRGRGGEDEDGSTGHGGSAEDRSGHGETDDDDDDDSHSGSSDDSSGKGSGSSGSGSSGSGSGGDDD